MYAYNLSQWLLFFFFYCVFGWCFESTYVSLKSHRFVNRGFLHGPFLPIYGSGAICVLFAALPFKDSPVMVYLIGAIAATILEYITGILMEALFKVRYWDYSKNKFNFRGHICLGSSIAWGFLSVGLIYVFHKPIETMVLEFSSEFTSLAAFLVSIVLAADIAISFKSAFEFRDALIKVENLKSEIRKIQKRLNVIEAVLADEVQKKSENIKANLDEALWEAQKRSEHMMEDMKEKLTNMTETQLSEELAQLKEKQAIYKDRIKNHLKKDWLHILRKNPSAKSDKYSEVWAELKEKLKEWDAKR